MKKFLRCFSSKKMFMSASLIAMMLTLSGTVALDAIEYRPLPSVQSEHFRGFYYWVDMANYKNLLLSNMPLDVLVGYIVADSVVRAAPRGPILDKISQMNLSTDTAQYIYKYWLTMNEYDPLRFFSYTRRRYPEAEVNYLRLHSDMRHKMYVDPKFTYVVSDYILHVYVNNTVHIDTSDATPHTYPSIDPKTKRFIRDSTGNFVLDTHIYAKPETIAYCKVLDTIKGGAFPSLSNAIFYNGPRPNPDEGGVVEDNTYADALFPIITPDIIFSYLDQWTNGMYRHSLYNPRDGHWIKPGREYIVFLELRGVDAEDDDLNPDGTPSKVYYGLWPYPHIASCSMYPIEDGYVIDRFDALGFGKKVPVEEFKQNIRDKISEIKSFGE